MTNPRPTAWLLLFLALSPAASAAGWQVEAAASRIAFQPTWEGAPFEGTIPRFEASIDFDPATPERGRFEVTFDMTSADTGDEDMNEGMRMPEWFDTGRFPKARYATESITAAGDSRYLARGKLTLKGVTRPVELPFTWSEKGGKARLRGETTLRRLDFNIGEGDWADDESIGSEVRVLVDLRLDGDGS